MSELTPGWASGTDDHSTVEPATKERTLRSPARHARFYRREARWLLPNTPRGVSSTNSGGRARRT